MFRPAVVLAAVVLATLPGRAPAQPVALPALRVLDVKADGDKLTWSEPAVVPVAVPVRQKVLVNGVEVEETRTVVVMRQQAVARSVELKGLKAIDGTGKAIAADKLAALLKEPTPVVFVSGPIPDAHRALFKDKTVFVELTIPPAPPPKLPLPVPPKM